MHFVLYCLDAPTSADLRPATRDEHLAYVAEVGAVIKVAGPMTDADGTSIGSMFIVELEDLAAAEAFSANDPYTKAGLFGTVDIRPFTWLITDGKRV